MPFIDDENTFGPISIDPTMNLTPKQEGQKTGAGAVIGAAFRTENPIVSALTSFDYDPLKPFDPEYRPWDDVQGTEYEGFSDRFTGARDAADVAAMKSQINQELEDRRTLDAAGASGMMAQMGAAILSPTTLLPGGALVKGAQGVKIGLTGLSVAAWTGLATSIDEVMLHATQQTRTGEESAFAIGGSIILGGILGSGVGALGKQEFKVAAQRAEQAVTMHNDFADGLRSIGAAENPQDFTIRREGLFKAVRAVPGLRAIVRSDPVIRPMLSEISSSRRALSDLVETPLQYKVNEEGQTVLNGEASVEALIKDRTHGSMIKSLSGLNKFYGEYWKDGPVGTLGTMTAPLQRWTQNLAGKTEKLSSRDFMEEVGKAMRRDDKHPIPQVQAAADMLRKEIFDPIKEEAIDFGIFDETLTELKHGNSYFSRVYQQEKIIAHRGDGSENDIMPTLRREFEKRRDIAQQNMAFDRRVSDLEADQFKLKETIRGTQRALDTARSKAVAKRERAKGAEGRSQAVGRATGALRRVFEKRSDDLKALTFTDAETDALRYALSDARGVKRLRPTDLLEAIRGYGGIKDPKIGTRWNGKGWSGGSATEIEQSLDTRARSIRRKDGKDIDTVREAMVEAGYLDEDTTVNDLLDAIDRAARGEDIFSKFDISEDVVRYEAALAFADEMDRLGVDISKPIDKIIAGLGVRTKAEFETSAPGNKGFDKWFGNSVVVDGDGDPMVAFHGTKAEIKDFNPLSWFTEEREMADDYSKSNRSSGDAPKVFEAYLKIEKPFNSDLDLGPSVTFQEFALSAMKQSGAEITDDVLKSVDAIVDGVRPNKMSKVGFWNEFKDETKKLLELLEFDGLKYGEESAFNVSDADTATAATYAPLRADQIRLVGGKYDTVAPSQVDQPFGRGMARNPKTAAIKSKEAGRSADVAGKATDGAEAGVLKALDRLEAAQARVRELDAEVAPKVRDEIKAARDELRKVIPELKKAKKAQDVEEFYAKASDKEIDEAVRDTVNALTGMKPGEAHYKAAMSNPTRARVLDVPDEVIEPWLQSNAQDVMAQYFRSMVPDLEIIKKFGDLEMTKVQEKINAEAARLMEQADSPKARNRIKKERDENLRDLLAMRDRMRGVYGVPADPRSGWIQGARTVRTLSYMGFLGGMTISAIPDVANVIGRAGISAAFGGSFTAITDPKRLALAAKDMAEIGAAADWHLNSRSIAMGDMFDPYGGGTRLEKGLAKGAAVFSQATGMVAWNVGWKSVGGAMVASKMSKAAERMAAGTASKNDMAALAANGIDRLWAERISNQIAQHGDKQGTLWLPRGQNWDDREAFDVFRQAMNREFDVMIVTPGQDLPLSFSKETGKFFLQFKSFAFSAHHRILLAGIQRADADVLAQVVGAMALGGLVSNIKAFQAGDEPKEGAAFWEDALDRSGLGGWLMEPYALAGALTNGMTTISGEEVSRYKSRSAAQGMLGPGVDMAVGMFEGAAAYGAGDASYRDVRKLMRPIPGNNLVWMTGLTRQIEDAVVAATGAKPRQ